MWNIWPNDVKWERRINCSFTKLQMTTLHSLEFEFLPFESWFEELTFVVVLKIVWFKFTSIHKKFKMQVSMRTSSNFFLRNTNIHKSNVYLQNIITGVGDLGYVILAVCTEPLPWKTHQHGNCYQRVYRYLFVFLNIKTSPKGLVPVFCYDQQKKQLRCT